ncbi:MAG TPA: hypothetical protein VFR49_04075 [Solirubrobacteraceae bacterium]|nr:hypothetical protein [Solirubrobacteraceae bacterium]
MLTAALEVLGVVALSANTVLAAVLVGYVAQAYQVGMFRRTAVDYLFAVTTSGLRSAPRERTVEEVGRYEQLRLLRAQIAGERPSCRTCNQAIASLLGDPGDDDVPAELAARRRELHREALGRLEALARGADADTILEHGRQWFAAETRRLAWRAVREIGPRAGRAFLARARRVIPDAALITGVLTLIAWPLVAARPLRQVTLGDVIDHAPTLGAGLGLVGGTGYVLVSMHRGALRSVLEAMSEREAVCFRRLFLAAVVLAAATFTGYYFGWPQDAESWLLRQARAVHGSWSFAIVAPVANVLCLRWIRNAWTIWRAAGIIVKWQRIEYLGSALFAMAILSAVDVLPPLRLARAGPGFRSVYASVAVVLFTSAGVLAMWSRRVRVDTS